MPDVDARDPEGFTALMRAAESGNLAELKKSIADGADINARNEKEGGLTALMYSAERLDEKAMEVLINNGADVNVVTGQGLNASVIAVKHYGSLKELDNKSLDILSKAGADFIVPSGQGATAQQQMESMRQRKSDRDSQREQMQKLKGESAKASQPEA